MNNLKELIEAQRAESIRPGVDVSDEKVLGILIARYLGWSGSAIVETAAAALTDANFHAEADALVRATVDGGW